MDKMLDFSWMTQGAAWVGLITLVALEVILGIDNIVFLSIISGKVAKENQAKTQKLGLLFAVIPRLVFLIFLGWIQSLNKPLFYLPFSDPEAGHEAGKHLNPCDVCENIKHMTDTSHMGQLGITGQNLVLLIGGVFLIFQATKEIHHKLEGHEEENNGKGKKVLSLMTALLQISLINIIFSLDSIVTAIGMVKDISVMMVAVIISTIIMAMTVVPVSKFIEKHPSVKILALSFLLMIGATLIGEAVHIEIPKGYVYSAMAFSVFVELINIRRNKKCTPVQLHDNNPLVDAADALNSTNTNNTDSDDASTNNDDGK
jgi:predicted tellurium resistance membrane protein TerC